VAKLEKEKIVINARTTGTNQEFLKLQTIFWSFGFRAPNVAFVFIELVFRD
jgi:hypothetical protein